MQSVSRFVIATLVFSASCYVKADSAWDTWSASANVSLVSDYVFRGFSYSDGQMATQGGFDLEHDEGFYAGAWGTSSVDPNGELNVYAGYVVDINDAIAVGLNAVRYHYPGGADVDSSGTSEYAIAVMWSDIHLAYHNDVHLDSDYIEANYARSLTDVISATLHIGRYDDPETSATDYGVTFDYQLSDRFSVFLAATRVTDDEEGSNLFAGVSASF